MRLRNSVASICILFAVALCAPQVTLGQYSISTIAGGGPSNPLTPPSIGQPTSVALDSAGNTYIADSYYSSQIFEVSTTGAVTVVAGNGTYGYSGDGGPATSATLNQPEGVFVDSSGNIYIADTGNSVIRVVNTGTTSPITIGTVTVQPGTIQTVAGTPGSPGFSGDGNPATSAQLNNPIGVFLNSQGNIFIADTDNSVIRVVNNGTSPITIGTVTIQPGTIQTVAGTPDSPGYSGDENPATSAQLDEPLGVTLDGQGNIYIADTYNSVIRMVNAQPVTIGTTTLPAGDIQTVAGNGIACIAPIVGGCGDGGLATSAQLNLPAGVFVDPSGDLFIADYFNFAIRKVVPGGTISTVAGTLGVACASYSTPATACGNGGSAISADLNNPIGVTADTTGDLFIADIGDFAVREVTGGMIQAFAGNSFVAYSGDGGPATGAQLNFPGSTFVDASGNVYIADSVSSVIRVVNTGTQAVTINNVTIQPGDIQTVAGDGIDCIAPIVGGCGDGGLATSAQLNLPAGVFVDGSDNIYIADTGISLAENSVIRVVNTGSSPITIAGISIPANSIQTVVGTLGTAGYSGDGESPTSAELFNPNAVLVDSSGNIFIADTGNSAVRVVNTGSQPLIIGPTTIQPGTIQTVAGTPPTACPDPTSGCGDGGPATGVTTAPYPYLNFPGSITLDSSGDIFIADTLNHAIRVVNSGTQPVTIAGTVIQPGDILTVAGTIGRSGYSGDNGLPTSALLDTPYGVLLDPLGNIFIADTDNSAIRVVVAVADTIQTVAGTGVSGFSGDGGSATSETLNGPESVALGGSGNIFIADTENSRIRQLSSTVAVAVAPTSAIVPISGTQQFLATVTGASNTSVTWQVNGATGGNATVGTIASDGLYQAPATQPSSAVTVTAISDANGTTSASAQVTIAASGAPAVTVSTSPSGVTVVYTSTTQASTTQAFTATVSGEANTAVTWEVNAVPSGNSTIGTIDATGLYSAPLAVPPQPLVIITAVSQADSSVSGSYPITIVTAPSAAQPPAQTTGPGGTANYSLSLKANTGNPHQAIKLSCLQSSLPPGASCTFTPPTITPSSSSVAFALAVTVPTGTTSLQKPAGQWLAPQIYVAFIPMAAILLLGSKSHSQRRRGLWLVLLGVFLLALIACGGGSSSPSGPSSKTYTIQIQGTTAAQPNPITITTASLTVQ